MRRLARWKWVRGMVRLVVGSRMCFRSLRRRIKELEEIGWLWKAFAWDGGVRRGVRG